MRFLLVILILFGLYGYNLSIFCDNRTPYSRCHCKYNQIQVCCESNEVYDIKCVYKRDYFDFCNNGTCTGGLSECNSSYTCPYQTSLACSALGFEGLCNVTSTDQVCCPISSRLSCFGARFACEVFGCDILNASSPLFNDTSGQIKCQNCSECDFPTQNPVLPNNKNSRVTQCPQFFEQFTVFNIQSIDVEQECIDGCRCGPIDLQGINPNCLNNTFDIQANCSVGEVSLCTIPDNKSICIDEGDALSECISGNVNPRPCFFPSTTSVPPVPPPVTPTPIFFPIPPIPPFPPFAPFAPIPSFPIPPIPPFPVPPTPISPTPTPIISTTAFISTTSAISPTILNGCIGFNPPQLDCESNRVRICCNVRCDFINITTGETIQSICAINNTNNLITACQECSCFQGNCPISPTIGVPITQNEIGLEIIIIIIVASVVLLCTIIAFLPQAINNNGFVTI